MNVTKLDGYENIFSCDLFDNEKNKLYCRDPRNRKQYDLWLNRQLKFLDSGDILSLTQDFDSFEKLKGVPINLYSIRRRGFLGNPRVLFFTIVEEGEKDSYLLLTAFKELNDGAYKLAIKTALERKKILLDDLK